MNNAMEETIIQLSKQVKQGELVKLIQSLALYVDSVDRNLKHVKVITQLTQEMYLVLQNYDTCLEQITNNLNHLDEDTQNQLAFAKFLAGKLARHSISKVEEAEESFELADSLLEVLYKLSVDLEEPNIIFLTLLTMKTINRLTWFAHIDTDVTYPKAESEEILWIRNI